METKIDNPKTPSQTEKTKKHNKIKFIIKQTQTQIKINSNKNR
jgi:hypothetical protein